MSLINSTAIPSGATYELEQSLRFNDGDSAYLSKTFASAGNRRTWTASAWVKRSSLGSIQYIWACTHTDDSIDLGSYFGSNDRLYLTDGVQGGGVLQTTQVFRDTSAWLHIVWALDTTQNTVNNRIKIYVNGVQVTDFANNAISSGISQNEEMAWMSANKEHRIGRRPLNNSSYLDGYIAEFNFVDGLVKAPADFGETGDYGEWKPIEYSGSYGTNGFYLNFAGGGIMSATGGNSTATDGDFKAASFTANGTFTPSANGYVEYLVIGGGGAGAGGNSSQYNGSAGGGGAGAYRTGMLPVTGGTAYSVVVGAGGIGRAYNYSPSGGSGNLGASSSFSTITSTGGGGGCSYGNTTLDMSAGGRNSSGGGGQGKSDNSRHDGGVGGTYGNDGGDGHAGGTAGAPNYGAGGGGGSGAVGVNGTTTVGGNGGAGTASSITGSSVTRAGGGGGSTFQNGGTQGSGGSGGGGAASGGNAGGNGSANTGSGGGGVQQSGVHTIGGSGGSGIVILRYKFQ